MIMKRLLVFLALIFFGLASFAQTTSGNPVPVDPDYRVGKLENGLAYYIRHNTEPAI